MFKRLRKQLDAQVSKTDSTLLTLLYGGKPRWERVG